MRASTGAALALWLAACGHHDRKPASGSATEHREAGATTATNPTTNPTNASDDVPRLPPAPPAPEPPLGLPARPPLNDAGASAIALGEVLFYDPRLSIDHKTACATCHDPAHDFSDGAPQRTANGAPNLRRAPSLANLGYRSHYGWDGRFDTVTELLGVHIKGQLGAALATTLPAIAHLPRYRALTARMVATPPTDPAPDLSADDVTIALWMYTATRFDGDSPWDRVERSSRSPGAPPAELEAGYKLFTGKAQCATCHTPPLYTDNDFHAIGLVTTHDEGRGRVDPAKAGAFVTPSLRGAANRLAFFHDGSAPTLEAAIDWHLAGGVGQGAAPSLIDPALTPIALTPTERAQLGTFVRALSAPAPIPMPAPPSLPQ